MTELSLRCGCGYVSGRVLRAERVHRNICHCRGCQAWASWLGRPELLDEAGGTDLLQITPAQLRIETGMDRVLSVRLTRKGAVRWYTSCCRTPVANSLADAWVPWLALSHGFLDPDEHPDSHAASLGPIRWRIHTKSAKQDVPGGHPTGPASLVLSTLWGTLRDVLRGEGKPHPFFDDRGQLVVPPEGTTDERRVALGLDSEAQVAVVKRKRVFGCG